MKLGFDIWLGEQDHLPAIRVRVLQTFFRKDQRILRNALLTSYLEMSLFVSHDQRRSRPTLIVELLADGSELLL